MDIRNFIRPIIAGLVGIGLIVLVIVLVSKAFSSHGGSSSTGVDVGRYADTAATVTLLVDPATNIDQEHHQVKITVSQTQNEIDILQGYQGTVADTRSYANNDIAYGAFLQALKLQDFSKGNSSATLRDYRGYCPTGNRYLFTFNDGNKDVFSYWATSCGQGTYKGNRAGTLNLFRRQIPVKDFNLLTNSIVLGF